MVIAVGEVFSGVFAASSSSPFFGFILKMKIWCRLRMSSGDNSKKQELSNMIVSGACLLMTSMALKSILQTQISKTSVLIQSFMTWSWTCLVSLVYQQTGGRPAGSCTAALFLKPFAEGIEAKDGAEPTLKWAHIDIAGSMEVFYPSIPFLEKIVTNPFMYTTGY